MPHRTSLAILLLASSIAAPAQWFNYRAPGTPRTPDGKPNLSAPAPRAQDHPDLSGVWQVDPTPEAEMTRLYGDLSVFAVPGDDLRAFSKYFLDVTADFKRGEAPIRPEANALFLKRMAVFGKDNPTLHCLPMSITGAYLVAAPFKIVQTPGLTLILREVDSMFRQIFTDGRPLPVDPQPAWLGYSVGKWDGDAFVIDTSGFNDKGWHDAGHSTSEALHFTERLRRRDFGHMDVEITIDDPKTFTKPFTIKFSEHLIPDSNILESVCAENERDSVHLDLK